MIRPQISRYLQLEEMVADVFAPIKKMLGNEQVWRMWEILRPSTDMHNNAEMMCDILSWRFDGLDTEND